MEGSDSRPGDDHANASLPYLALMLGVFFVSTSAILIKLVPHLPVLAIGAFRLLITCILLLPLVLFSKSRRRLARTDWCWLLGSGLFLALHFVTWIASLRYTSVAVSTALVSIHPLLVALVSWIWLKERPSPAQRWGMLVTGIGLLIATVATANHGGSLYGDLLAFLGAVFAAGYLIIGRRLRQYLDTTQYSFWVYLVAGTGMLSAFLATGPSVGRFTLHTGVIVVLMALLPTLGGHTVFNWTLRYLPATTVSLAFLGEVAGASLLAWALLHQVPSPTALVGVAIILAGLAITITGTTRTVRPPPATS